MKRNLSLFNNNSNFGHRLFGSKNWQSSTRFNPPNSRQGIGEAPNCGKILLNGHLSNFKRVPQWSVMRSYSSSAESKNANCWSCKKQLDRINGKNQFFCSHCGCIQAIGDNVDYFAIMGLSREFNLDNIKLTQKFRQLQSVLHPDKFSNKTEAEQTLSADWSSLINKAYKTLSVPIKRAEYILQLHGVSIPEENTAVNPAFLMDMMERNEEVEDADRNSTELSDLLAKVRKDLSETVEKIEIALQKSDLDAAKSQIITLKYFISLENSIKEKIEKL